MTRNLQADLRLATHLSCLCAALALGGCLDGPIGVAPSAGLGVAADNAGLSPAAPTLHAGLITPPARLAPDSALATDLDVTPQDEAPDAKRAHYVLLPLPPSRPAAFAAVEPEAIVEGSSEAKAEPDIPAPPRPERPAPSALPALTALTLIAPRSRTPAAQPKTQLASLFVEGARLPLPASEALGGASTIEKQTERVETGCFPQSLRDVLAQIGQHFGGLVIVTSGYRSAGENRHAGGARYSYHVKCLAADIQIDGIAPGDIARYARSLDAVGGVGRYGHTKSVHVDVGERKFSWFGLHRRHRRS